MRFHVVALPHTQTTKEFLPCAYTQKVRNFCKMMMSLGHEVFLYASEDVDVEVTELITCITKMDQIRTLGQNDWKKKFFAIEWQGTEEYWRIQNANAIEGMKKRLQPKDFICLIAGWCQKPIADAFPAHTSVEFGIGYRGVFAKHKVFESYAWMHWVYGSKNDDNGKSYDTVIPNYFDPADFVQTKKTLGDRFWDWFDPQEEYFLYVGRMISRKGIETAAEVCKRLGKKLILAGQGVISVEPGKIVAQEITITGNVYHVGVIDAAERLRLMSGARAVFVPTNYVGPFEGVHAEALMCGTPVISTDWGVFTETIVDGVNGYRTRTIGEAMWAARNVHKLDRKAIRKDAIARWSMDTVKYRYQDYFHHLLGLWNDGPEPTDWYRSDYDPMDKRVLGNFR